jgi:hypothetical protein
MKKVILLLTLLLLLTHTFAQDTTLPVLTKEDFLKKSKSQKTGAWLLLGTSVVSLLGSAASYEFTVWGDQSDIDNTGSTVLAIVGVGALASSITLFVAAGRNRRKAAYLTINQESILLPENFTRHSNVYPVANLVIRLNSR